MSQLEHTLESFLRARPGLEERLVYRWQGQGEAETDRLFAECHRRLTDALRNRHRDLVKACIIDIVHVWGGITSYQRLADRYPDLLFHLDESNPVGPQSLTPLSSWTKVLAVYKPEKFSIYDSRVAVALRVLFPQIPWFLPPARANRALLMLHLARRGGPELSPQETYARYLDLLHETGRPIRFERMLFMLGGLLGFDAAKQAVVLLNNAPPFS